MVAPATGSVVLVPFPFSNLAESKMRPAVVLADVGRGDWILCQVASNPYGDPQAVELTEESFASGSLRITSYARTCEIRPRSAPRSGSDQAITLDYSQKHTK